MNDMNCGKGIKLSIDKGFKQQTIFWVIRNSILFLSMITFSLRGKMFRKLIEDLRKLFSKLHNRANGRQLFEPIVYLSIIIFFFYFIFVSIVLSVLFHSNISFSLKTIYLFIAEFHLELIHFSTDFYVLYFISYLVILQKLFITQLKEYNS
jgi:hypothetical protein